MDRKEALAQTGAVHFERVVRPGLIDLYEREAACWVVTGDSEWGRAFATPKEVPEAIAYYRELRRRAVVSYHISPYGLGKQPEPFNFDWSTDYYPLGLREARTGNHRLPSHRRAMRMRLHHRESKVRGSGCHPTRHGKQVMLYEIRLQP